MREATIHIPHGEFDSLGIGRFVSHCREAGLEAMTELACRGDGCLFVVRLDSELPESDLDSLPGVRWWERLDTSDGGVAYLCAVTTSEQSAHREAVENATVANHEVRVDDAGVDVSIVGTQAALVRSVEKYDDVGVDVVLERITDYAGPRTSLDAVTERQRDVLETAYEMGYFEVPREVSVADVAADLGLDPSTVSEHLRRGERNLLSELLGG